MGKKITIHYRSPKGDPFKVPRPHRAEVENGDRNPVLTGGEIGGGLTLIGFSKRETPKQFVAPQWFEASALIDGDVDPATLVGYYPQFTPVGAFEPFGHELCRVERIEIVEED